MRGPLRLSPGDARTFAIAGVGIRFISELQGRVLSLPWSFALFEDRLVPVEVEARIGSAKRLDSVGGELLFDSSLHWRALAPKGSVVFELFHPPTAQTYCRMSVDSGFSRAAIVFAEDAWLGLGADKRAWSLPHPLDQLLLAPALGLRGACLVHACGAAVNGEAMVFAGHSGDGKTTLAKLLERERFDLLSDERVALRADGSEVFAYGTPWPGEGDIVSADRHPLAQAFILRKGSGHVVRTDSAKKLAPELVARSILPFYLPSVASRMLAVLDSIVSAVSLQELWFARAAGLGKLLTDMATSRERRRLSEAPALENAS